MEAEKVTLMRLILGEMKPDEGEIILMNNDPRLKKRIGYVSQNGISKNQSFPATVEEIMITGLLSGTWLVSSAT